MVYGPGWQEGQSPCYFCRKGHPRRLIAGEWTHALEAPTIGGMQGYTALEPCRDLPRLHLTPAGRDRLAAC